MSEFVAEYEISMLGNRGVGKTSMIASMKDVFDRVFPDPTLQLNADEETEMLLHGLTVRLKRVATGKPGYVETGSVPGGVEGTTEPVTHRLDVRHTTTSSVLRVAFHDYPGAWLQDNAVEVDKRLGGAAVILVAVDAAALMELGEAAHEERTSPGLIASTLRRVLARDPGRRRLVLFVLVRAEKWVQAGDHDGLRKRLDDRYAPALRAVRGYPQTVAAAICPIQTLGSVLFSHYVDESRPMFQRVADKYDPRDCDQPLRYALAFLLNEVSGRVGLRAAEAQLAHDSRSWFEKWWAGLVNVFGGETDAQRDLRVWASRSAGLLGVLAKYAKGCKLDPPFGFVQNQQFLGL